MNYVELILFINILYFCILSTIKIIIKFVFLLCSYTCTKYAQSNNQKNQKKKIIRIYVYFHILFIYYTYINISNIYLNINYYYD